MRKKYPIFTDTPTDKESIIQIFENHRNENGYYPSSHEINTLAKKYPVIPTSRTIQSNGGLRRFYESLLNVPYIDARTGNRRAGVARTANQQALTDEDNLSKILVDLFGENNVHHRSPFPNQSSTWFSSDFKVFISPNKFFFIDVFSATGIFNLTGCVNLKASKLEKIGCVSTLVFFVSCSDTVSQHQIEQYVKAKKKPFPPNVTLSDINTAIKIFKKLAIQA